MTGSATLSPRMPGDPIFPDPAVLRLSVTDRCNLRCRYCMPEGPTHLVPASELLTLEALTTAVAWLKEIYPFVKIKITGGEPLLRQGICSLIRNLSELRGLQDLSMTTNGSGLERRAAQLRLAGLNRVNVSLDTLDPQRFQDLTGGRLLDTLKGLRAAVEVGLHPVKLNAVLRRSCWREDVPRLLDFAASEGFELRFIELMETGVAADWARHEFVPTGIVRSWLESNTPIEPMPGSLAEPARRTILTWQGAQMAVGWISPQSHRFCTSCNRVRLDARGRLRRCLMDPHYFPLTDYLHDQSSAPLAQLVRLYIERKQPPAMMTTSVAMAAMGG